ncbi:Crp/Fnr family transcriptional regulator [Nocardiopsis sp. NPDC006938]|uniref:Crp/Fnr family transcriptional regulator n=1 Tax=Nocardiopsis sp. NPDC006938 TaxID=3364337 RepID=UPI0036CD358E
MPRHGFGSLLTDEQWSELVSTAHRRSYGAGEALLNQGAHGLGVHLVLSGRVRVVSLYPDGTSAPLAYRTRGEILGESVLAGGGRACNATVTALAESRTAYLSAERFQTRLRELDLVSVLWQSVLNRQDESDQVRVQLARLPAERRLPAALVHLAAMLGEPAPAALTDGPERPGPGRILRIPLPQEEVGGFTGLSRTSVYKAYNQLRELGLIRTGRQFVAVVDLDRLEALAFGEDRGPGAVRH